MNQRERLEEIRKRHEEEQRKRKFFVRRVLLAAASVIAVVIIALVVWACILAATHIMTERQSEKAEIVTTAAPAVLPTANPSVISRQYYKNSAFVGNSFVEEMFIYDILEATDYFYKIGLSVEQAMTEPMENQTAPVIGMLKNEKKYSKVFLVFGENELGWKEAEGFISQYSDLIDKVREYQPESEIYLLAITPVTKKTSDENIDNTNNDRIRMYNELIKELAAEKNVVYADVYSAVADSEGNLPEGAASDGVHFGKDYYEKCLLYIQNNY